MYVCGILDVYKQMQCSDICGMVGVYNQGGLGV